MGVEELEGTLKRGTTNVIDSRERVLHLNVIVAVGGHPGPNSGPRTSKNFG